MTDIEHILLDLDGTLTDSKEGITKSVQYALNKLGMAIPCADDLEWAIGPPLVDAFKKLLGKKNQHKLQSAVNFYRERYADRCAVENKLYDGIQETLKCLKDQRFSLYLATSKPWPYAEKILDHFNLTVYFDGIYGSELDGTRDYKEDLIHYILTQQRLDNTKTLMVGDRHYDVQGAKCNNVRSIGVTYGYGSVEEITHANPDAVVHAHHQIPQIIS